MEKYNDKICRHALNKIFGFKPVTALELIERYGSAAKLFETGGSRLLEETGAKCAEIVDISDSLYEAAAGEMRQLEKRGARFLCENDPNYPALLKECPDRPIGLYVRSESSDAEIFSAQRKFIAVVGTRDISPYGVEWCTRIVGAMAMSPVRTTVVSGLAIGTDIIAHRKAMECGLPTIAVLPTGIDAVYPSRHFHDARKIAARQGCAVVTDYPPMTAPVPFNFLRRNRIIAGLSGAVLLIESKVKGGGMMTARLGASYSRDVYALPGRVSDLRSQGCISLIRDKVAESIFDEWSLMKNLGLKPPANAVTKKRMFDREFVEKRFADRMGQDWIDRLLAVLTAVKETSGADVEQISRICGYEYRDTAQLVSVLECDGLLNIDIMQRCAINYG
ncbi:MAG: DNA-protecting protein DprA [Bacteroidales bacterium]|nr:DNA-protecting protein DprA [Bacteroidales bacterium]